MSNGELAGVWGLFHQQLLNAHDNREEGMRGGERAKFVEV